MTRRDALIAGSLSVGLAAALVPFARIGVDAHHDGVMLKTALDLVGGQTLFRETFTQYGALTAYLHASALLFLPTLLGLKLLTVGAYAATLFVLYAAWRLLLPRSLTLLSCGLYAVFLPAYEKSWVKKFWILNPWSSVLAMFFQAVGLYALLRVIRGEQAKQWGLLLGMACAAAFGCRQPVGLTMAGTLVLVAGALFWTKWQPAGGSRREILGWSVAGFAGVTLALLASICLSGAYDDWWYQNYTWPGKWASGSGGNAWRNFLGLFLHPEQAAVLAGLGLALALPLVARRFRPNLPAGASWIYYTLLVAVCIWQREAIVTALSPRSSGWPTLLPGVIAIQALVSIAAGFNRSEPKPLEYYLVAVTAAIALGSLPQYFPVPDVWHVFWALAPGFGLCVYALWRWSGAAPLVVVAVLSSALLPMAVAKIAHARELHAQPMVTLESPAALRGMRVTPEKAAAFQQIEQTLAPILQRDPDMLNALLGNDALYLCFTNNRINPSPYFVTWPGLLPPAANQQHWNFVAQHRPLLFIHQAKWEAVDDFYRRARYVPLIYLAEENLAIAVPHEMADAMNLKVHDPMPPATAAPETSQP